MEWYEVSIVTTSEAVDAISEFIHQMGLHVSITDPSDMLNTKNTVDTIFDDDFITTDDVFIKIYFPEGTNINDKVSHIKNFINDISEYINIGKGEIVVKEVKGEDWENSWKKYYKPIEIGEKVIIKPSWEEYLPKDDNKIIVEMDPGAAFGTGTHETTRLCVGFLEKYINNNDTVLDIGCGSGILSICSSKLGAAKVIGVDIDELAVKASNDNIALNNLDNVEIRQGNLFDVVTEKANVVVANIIADVIISIAPSVERYLKQNGTFICSGIIKDRADDVIRALESNGYKIIDKIYEGEWVAFVSQK